MQLLQFQQALFLPKLQEDQNPKTSVPKAAQHAQKKAMKKMRNSVSIADLTYIN